MSYQSERLRDIADKYLARGSKDWAELMQISGYIEGLEEGRDLRKGADQASVCMDCALSAPSMCGGAYCARDAERGDGNEDES